MYCIFLTSSSQRFLLVPGGTVVIEEDDDVSSPDDDNDVGGGCGDESFDKDEVDDMVLDVGKVDANVLDDDCVGDVCTCLSEHSDFDDVNDDTPRDDDDRVTDEGSFDDVGNGACDDKSSDDDVCRDKSLDAFVSDDVNDDDQMYVCLEGRSGCTVVNDDNDDTAPGSQLVTVDTCALCSDGNDADNSDNGFVDKSFGDVSVDDVNVVYRDDLDTDKECSDS
jgi:hypothetical protein